MHDRDRSGLVVGLIAVILTLVLGYWVSDQLERTRTDHGTEIASVRGAASEARLAAQRASDASVQSSRALEESTRRAIDEQAARVEAARVEQRRVTEGVDARLQEMAREIAAMRETFGQVGRHDQELVALQQRYNALEAELAALGASLERQIAEAAQVAPVEAPPPQKPAWIGLVEGLASANPSERWQAVNALGETRDPAAAEYVLPSLADADIFIRMTAARVLGELASPAAIEPLIGALEDEEGAVREAAYGALKTLTGRDLPFEPQSTDAAERAKRVKAWQEWWKKERERAGS